MEEFNNAAVFKRVIQKGGDSFTYIKVKRAISGEKKSTTKDEKKQLLSVMDDIYNQVRLNILKS